LGYKGNYAGTYKRGLTNDCDAYNLQPKDRSKVFQAR